MNYEPLHAFALKHRVPYNELCAAARAAAPSQQPAPARPDEFVCPHCFDEGAAPQAAQSGMVPVAFCELTPNGSIAYFDGKPMVMCGPVGNECHTVPLYAAPQAVPFDRTTALVLLQAASKSGDPGAISLAAQLAGAAPCKDCGYVNFKCRCAKTAPQAVPRRVRKIGGSFQHTGTVVAEFTTTAGEPRIVLEFDPPVAGMLHVYRPDQVEPALDAPQAVPQPLTPFGLTYKAHLQDALKWLDSRRERLHHEGCSIHAPSAQCNCGLHKALTHIRAVVNAVEDHTATKDAQIAKLKTVMIAAAEEIQSHWDAHCDAEGYGPANLMRRLEEGIPSQYGYTAGRFAELEAERDRLREALRKARFALRYHMEQTRPIEHTIDVLRAIEEVLCD